MFLHTSNPLKKDEEVDDEHEKLTGYSVAEITEALFNFANSALTRIGLGHDHHVITVRTWYLLGYIYIHMYVCMYVCMHVCTC